MTNLRDIRKRISSVESTKQITRTMEMVATAKITPSFKRINAANPYASAMKRTLGNVAKNVDGSAHPLLAKHEEVKTVLFVLITSDRGLAGGFNSNVLREFEHRMQQAIADGAKAEVISCGKKAISYLNYRKITPLRSFVDLSADPTVDEAREIASISMERFTAGDADEVVLIYNHARNSADQDLTVEQVLPIDTSAIVDAQSEEAKESEEGAAPEGGYEFEPSPEEVLGALLPSYVETSIFHALIDSAAAEQGARRKAMMAATDNATEMLESLSRLYNRVRQGAITTELTEIVGGAAGLED
jgi:F-type H+-transporting ATPase subunit gamma